MTPASWLLIIAIALLLVIARPIVRRAVFLLASDHRVAVLRPDTSVDLRGPGLVLINPFKAEGVAVSLAVQTRSETFRAFCQPDNLPIDVSAKFSFKVVDPRRAILQVRHVSTAFGAMAVVVVQGLIKTMAVGEVWQRRAEIATEWVSEMDDVGRRWGVEPIEMELTGIDGNVE